MNKLDVFKYLLESNSALSVPQIILSMCICCVLSFFMYLIYKKTYSGSVYSKNFNQTLVLIALIVTVVMSIIGSNLALSLGMVGSLSIIRFRTAIKEPRDIAFLFWAIAIGLSCGSEVYLVGIIGSVVIALVLIIFNFDIYTQTSYLLVYEIGIENEKLENIYRKYTRKYKIRAEEVQNKKRQVTVELSLDDKKVSQLLEELDNADTIKNYNFVSFNGEIIG